MGQFTFQKFFFLFDPSCPVIKFAPGAGSVRLKLRVGGEGLIQCSPIRVVFVRSFVRTRPSVWPSRLRRRRKRLEKLSELSLPPSVIFFGLVSLGCASSLAHSIVNSSKEWMHTRVEVEALSQHQALLLINTICSSVLNRYCISFFLRTKKKMNIWTIWYILKIKWLIWIGWISNLHGGFRTQKFTRFARAMHGRYINN